MTREQVLELLAGGSLDDLIGQREDNQLEFKSEPYQLNDEAGRFELAKDVAALANADGGVIVIGVRTERTEEALVDQATAVRAFDVGLVDTGRYSQLFSERVYPPLRGVSVQFQGVQGERERGIVVIDVPPQREDDKLFLVLKPLSEGEAAQGWLVGIAVRSVDRVEVYRAQQLHGLMNRGTTVGSRLDELAAEVRRLAERLEGRVEPPPTTPADQLPAVLEERAEDLDRLLDEDR